LLDVRACEDNIRVRRKSLEDSILGPVRRELFAPERIAKMAQGRSGHGAR
jgi:hypothetical protein